MKYTYKLEMECPTEIGSKIFVFKDWNSYEEYIVNNIKFEAFYNWKNQSVFEYLVEKPFGDAFYSYKFFPNLKWNEWWYRKYFYTKEKAEEQKEFRKKEYIKNLEKELIDLENRKILITKELSEWLN
jgi:hypothetical protein